MADSLKNQRREYEGKHLSEEGIAKEPLEQFKLWYAESEDQKVLDNNAMYLATVSHDAQPSLRTVLLKEFSNRGFIFYGDYESKKSIQLSQNSKAALLFHYREMHRQIRIEGDVTRISLEKSKEYFYRRPKGSQLAALVSKQSHEISSRQKLQKNYDEAKKAYETKTVPFKGSWGGFLLSPALFEFWQGQANRLHDRIEYVLQSNNNWKIRRLQP